MKYYVFKTCLLLLAVILITDQLQAQGSLIRRVQERTEQRIVNEIFGESDKKNQNQQSETESDENNRNRRGTGLNQNAPDVKANIKQANEAYTASNYTQSKNAIKNALWGVELEIGKKVLESLPKSVEGMSFNERQDKVSSTGAGFVGLIIERTYNGKDDMQVKATIGNDSALLGIAGFYMMGDYMQSTDQPDQKQTRFKDHNAVIRYTEYDGYTLSVPFGQSSVFIINGVNFGDENEFMAAANNFDLDVVKKELGVNN